MSIKKLKHSCVSDNSLKDVEVYVKRYASHVMRMLNMSDYDLRVYVSYDKDSNESHAKIMSCDKYTYSELYINYAMFKTCDRLNRAILHECIHCALHELDTAYHAIEVSVPDGSTRDLLQYLFDKGIETATSRLTASLHKHFKPDVK